MEGSQDIIMEQQVQPATWTLLLDERQHLHKHYTRMIQEVTGPGSALALRVQELEKAHGAKEYELRHLRIKQNQLELDMTRKEQSWELSLQQSRKAFESEIEKAGTGAMELLAMDMKSRGMFVSRQLSFHGRGS